MVTCATNTAGEWGWGLVLCFEASSIGIGFVCPPAVVGKALLESHMKRNGWSKKREIPIIVAIISVSEVMATFQKDETGRLFAIGHCTFLVSCALCGHLFCDNAGVNK